MDTQRPSTLHQGAKRSANVLTTVSLQVKQGCRRFQFHKFDLLVFCFFFLTRVWGQTMRNVVEAKRGL